MLFLHNIRVTECALSAFKSMFGVTCVWLILKYLYTYFIVLFVGVVLVVSVVYTGSWSCTGCLSCVGCVSCTCCFESCWLCQLYLLELYWLVELCWLCQLYLLLEYN